MSALLGDLFWVAVPVAIMERTPVVASLLRSLELTRARYPAVLALYLLLSVLLIGAAFVRMIRLTPRRPMTRVPNTTVARSCPS